MSDDLTGWEKARNEYRAMIGDSSKHLLDNELVETIITAAAARDTVNGEIDRLQKQIRDHVERIAAQSELLSRRAEKSPPWTLNPPVVTGWYWWRKPGYAEQVVQVAEWPGGGLAVRIPEVAEHSDGYAIPERVGGEWCGPLARPTGAAVPIPRLCVSCGTSFLQDSTTATRACGCTLCNGCAPCIVCCE